MFIAKKIAVKFAISLAAGVASTIGVRVTNAVWDRTVCNKKCMKTKESFAR